MDRKKLALIHIIKKELNLTDEEYRKILMESAQVTSAKDLTDPKFRKLMSYFIRSKHYRVNPYGLTLKQTLYIKFLSTQLKWDTGHLSNFINKYYHKLEINTFTRKEAINLIESLKNVLRNQV